MMQRSAISRLFRPSAPVNPPPSGPSWYTAANSSEWSSFSSSTWSGDASQWTGTSPGGNNGVNSVVNAWSGGILNTVGCYYGGSFHAGTYQIIFGGGHTNWGGNDIYAFGPFESDTPTWHRLTDPTVPGPRASVYPSGRDGSGNPVARHTYDSLQFLPTLNKMLCMGAAGTHDGNSGGGNDILSCDLFDFATNTWSAIDGNYPTLCAGMNTLGCKSGYNPVTNKAWQILTGNAKKLVCFDVATQVWTGNSSDNPNDANYQRAALVPAANLLVMISITGTVLVKDLNNPSTVGITTVTTSGTGPSAGQYTLNWDSTRSRIIMRESGSASKKLYFLSVPASSPLSNTWVWTSTTPASGVTPGAWTADSVFGRDQYMASLDVFITMPSETSPISFYKF